MRSVVGLVRARPETIIEDYRRAMALAGVRQGQGEGAGSFWPAWSGRGYLPGFDSPCWQIAGVAGPAGESSADSSGTVHPLGANGPLGGFPGADSGWAHALVVSAAQKHAEKNQQFKAVQPRVALPALAAVLPEGFAIPAGFNRHAVLMPVPVLNRAWQLAGGVALAAALVAGKVRMEKKIPPAEVIAEALALALEAGGCERGLATVMDGVVWGVHGEDGRPHGLVRNLLLAGNDPVAVDSVAARLAGLDPARIPWLQLCADRGLGHCDPTRVDVRGDTDLLELDLEIPEVTFRTADRSRLVMDRRGEDVLNSVKAPGRVLGRIGRKDPEQGFATSGWGALQRAFATGGFPPL